MADKRIGFIHQSNKMRTKWEEGVRNNIERLRFAVANYETWKQNDGWSTCPEYMHRLEHEIKKQRQYLRNRYGEVIDYP
jgi:hypothetical protein